jgi:hypothetical protein
VREGGQEVVSVESTVEVSIHAERQSETKEAVPGPQRENQEKEELRI